MGILSNKTTMMTTVFFITALKKISKIRKVQRSMGVILERKESPNLKRLKCSILETTGCTFSKSKSQRQ